MANVETHPGTPGIGRLEAEGKTNPLISQSVLDQTTEVLRDKQGICSLVDHVRRSVRRDYRYQMHWFTWDLEAGLSFEEALANWSEVALKGRGSNGGSEDLNSHFETFVVREGKDVREVGLSELREHLVSLGSRWDLIGLSSIGNKFQTIVNTVQGIDEKNPKSGNERPQLGEGPHMVLAIYGLDSHGNLHIFRQIQMRKGEAVVDTFRGFADQKTLESGESMYEIEGAGERIKANITRVIGEEAGEQLLQIKAITFLGAPVPNTTFVANDKKSAMFAVEVDYDHFIASNKVVGEEEFERRREQFEHEGITGLVVDLTLGEYVNHVRNSSLRTRDLTADSPVNTVVIDYLHKSAQAGRDRLKRTERLMSIQAEFWKHSKKADPEGYIEEMRKRAEFLRKTKKS